MALTSTYTSISAGQTDANSPMDTILMDALRQNQDVLYEWIGGPTYTPSTSHDHNGTNSKQIDITASLEDFRLRDVTNQTVSNTTVETEIFSDTIPANKLGTTKGFRLTLLGQIYISIQEDFTMRVKFGGTTIGTLVSTGIAATPTSWAPVYTNCELSMQNSASLAMAISRMTIGTKIGIAGESGAILYDLISGHSSITEATTAAVTLSVTAQHQAADVNNSYLIRTVQVEII